MTGWAILVASPMRIFLAFALFICTAASARSETLPRFTPTSLSGHPVYLPDAARDRVAILIVGFTQGSAKASAAWRQKMDPDFGKNPAYVIYDLAILEDVPRLFRSLVVSAIRKGIPAALQDTFLTSFQDEKMWKQLTTFGTPNDAYLLILDRRGAIQWQIHGLCTDAQYAAFRDRARGVSPAGP